MAQEQVLGIRRGHDRQERRLELPIGTPRLARVEWLIQRLDPPKVVLSLSCGALAISCPLPLVPRLCPGTRCIAGSARLFPLLLLPGSAWQRGDCRLSLRESSATFAERKATIRCMRRSLVSSPFPGGAWERGVSFYLLPVAGVAARSQALPGNACIAGSACLFPLPLPPVPPGNEAIVAFRSAKVALLSRSERRLYAV